MLAAIHDPVGPPKERQGNSDLPYCGVAQPLLNMLGGHSGIIDDNLVDSRSSALCDDGGHATP